jgi:hypothetical protein
MMNEDAPTVTNEQLERCLKSRHGDPLAAVQPLGFGSGFAEHQALQSFRWVAPQLPSECRHGGTVLALRNDQK